jgi:hypothetical protein
VFGFFKEAAVVSRSLKVHPQFLESVGAAYEQALMSSRCSQKEFAELIKVTDTKIGMGVDTLNKFLKGEAIDRPYFFAICDRIGLRQKISKIGIPGDADPEIAQKERDGLLEMAFAPELKGGELATMPGVIDADYVDVRDEQQKPGQGSETTPSISIEQETETNEGFMFGHSGQVNINQAGQSQPSEPEGQKAADAEPVVPQTAKSVKQSAKINKGFMFGSSDQVNIHSKE